MYVSVHIWLAFYLLLHTYALSPSDIFSKLYLMFTSNRCMNKKGKKKNERKIKKKKESKNE